MTRERQELTRRRRRLASSRAVLVAAALCLAGCDSPAERLAKHYERGVELAEIGEPLKAVLEFRNALRLDETHVPSLFGIAEALEASGDLRGAIGHLTRVLEVDPGHVPARIKLSQGMLLAGDLEAALKHASTALTLSPENPDALATRAAAALRLGDIPGALSAAKAALVIAPDHARAGTVLIAERLADGDAYEAMVLVERFLQANPADLALNLARLRLLEQDPLRQKALGEHLERMVQIFPAERGLHLALATFHRNRGDDAAAIDAMRALAARDPHDVETALHFIDFLHEVDGEASARAELEIRIEAADNPKQAFHFHRTLAELDLAAGDLDRAKARFDRLIRKRDLPAARIARARLHLAEGERSEARDQLGDVLQDDARNVDALALRAALEIDEGDPDAAVLTLRTALAEAPNRVELRRLSAIAHARTGNARLAGENMAAAVRISDYEPEITLAYVQFLHQRTRTDAVATVLEEALRRHPESRALLAAAARLHLDSSDWLAAEKLVTRLAALGDSESRGLADLVAAEALRAQGRLRETIEIFEAMTGRPESRAAALTRLVHSYVQAERADDAVAFVESVLSEPGRNANALVMRGALHALAGENEPARMRYREAAAAAPDSPDPWLALMRLAAAGGDLAAAQAVLSEGLAAVPPPSDQPLRLALAGLQEAQGDIEGAIGTYRELYSARPDSLVVVNNLVSLLSDHRADDPESLAFAARVARRLSDIPIPQFQDTFGWTLYLAGDHDGALRHLLAAVEALPGNPWVRFHIGQTYAALGEATEARANLRRARELGGPDFPRRAKIEATLASLKGLEAH